jgi:hypothetical protein
MSCLAFYMAAGMSLTWVDLSVVKSEREFLPAAMTCKSVAACEDAVRLWCGGYKRADGDKDGIPCENVCESNTEVEEIVTRNGC